MIRYILRLKISHCMDGCRLLSYPRILLAVVKSLLILLHDLHFKSWINCQVYSCMLINCRSDYCQTSTSIIIQTLLQCSLKASRWMR